MKFLFLVLWSSLIVSGCSLFNKEVVGSGTIASETRKVENFKSIVIAGQGNLFITQGEQELLKIETDDNLLPLIKSEVVNGVLRIEQNSDNVLQKIKPSKPINFYITVKDIEAIDLAGTGQITSESKLKGKTLSLSVSGAGKVDLNVGVEKLISRISGSAQYTLKGSADDQEISISGAGLYEAPDLNSKRTSVNISGYGRVAIKTEETLDINIAGNGSVYYSGDPKITKQVHGNGKIEQVK